MAKEDVLGLEPCPCPDHRRENVSQYWQYCKTAPHAGRLLNPLRRASPDHVSGRDKALGVDHFTYCASCGLGFKEQKRSLELFIKEVMPAFSEPGRTVAAVAE